MPKVPVQKYEAEWNPKGDKWNVWVVIKGTRYQLPVETYEEFTVALLMLGKVGAVVDTDNWDIEIPARAPGE